MTKNACKETNVWMHGVNIMQFDKLDLKCREIGCEGDDQANFLNLINKTLWRRNFHSTKTNREFILKEKRERREKERECWLNFVYREELKEAYNP